MPKDTEKQAQWNPINKCEAQVRYRTVQHPRNRFVYDMEGRQVDLGAHIQEQPGEEELTITCAQCRMSPVLRAKGDGPYGHINAARQLAREYLSVYCLNIYT